MCPRSSFRRCEAVFVFVLALAVTVLAAEPAARPGDSVGWHTIRPGETLISITAHYLGDPDLWPENMRLNPQITDPKKLRPGSKIRVIVSRQLPAKTAKMNRLARRVDDQPVPSPWLPARVGDLLKENDGVRTFERSSAELVFDDGSNLVMTEQSLVYLKQVRESLKGVGVTSVEIVDGQADLHGHRPRKNPSDIEIVVGSASIKPKPTAAQGAMARARKGSQSSAQVMIYGGTGEMVSAGAKVQIPAGMGTTAAAGKPPAPPEKLLRAPAIRSVLPGGVVSSPVDLRWEAVPRAASYTVEVCGDSDCAQLVDRAVGIERTSWSAELPAGEYFWRVTAVGASGLDGFPSAAARFSSRAPIAGVVREDPDADGRIDDGIPIAGSRVVLYRDSGDGTPDDRDRPVGEARTAADGTFRFGGPVRGTYWIAFDSRSVRPGTTGTGAWADQTWASAGALCVSHDSVVALRRAGPCIGGRFGDASDDASRLSTSRHVVRIDVGDGDPGPAEIAFSFAVVDRTGDSPASLQGTLRQYILNAKNGATGRPMRFVPLAPPGGSGGGTSWWTVVLSSALPPLPDGAALDGEARDPAAPEIALRRPLVSRSGIAKPLDDRFVVPLAPALAIDFGRAGEPLRAAGDVSVTNVALFGNAAGITADGRLELRDSLIGLRPDLQPDGDRYATGVVLAADGSTIERTLIAHRNSGLVANAPARITDLGLLACGSSSTAAAVIRGNGSVLTRVCIAGPHGGTAMALEGVSSVEVRASKFADASVGVLFAGAAHDNLVEKSLFSGLASSAVAAEPGAGPAPIRNQVRESDFLSVGSPIAEGWNDEPWRAAGCSAGGAPHPQIGDELDDRVPHDFYPVDGTSCGAKDVEIYLVRETPGAAVHDLRYARTVASHDGRFAVLLSREEIEKNIGLTAVAFDAAGNTSRFGDSISTAELKAVHAKKPPPRDGGQR